MKIEAKWKLNIPDKPELRPGGVTITHFELTTILTLFNPDMKKGADARTLTAEILWKLVTPSN